MAFVLVFAAWRGNVFPNGALNRPDFSHQYIYPFIAVLAAFLTATKDVTKAVGLVRSSLLVFLVVSAACIVVQPSLVLQSNYLGILPGFRYRYVGLASHANGLGPLAVTFLVCLMAQPFRHRWLTFFAWGLGGVSLLLSQSKTSYAAAIVALGVMLLAQALPRLAVSSSLRDRIP
jgi:hypothetical protein